MKYLHTMVRVSDLERSLDFYCRLLGLREVRRLENERGRFTLVFLAAGDGGEHLELTHNWDPETYGGGRNFGHLAYRVDDIYALCKKLMDNGVTINRPLRDGHMAFVRSPDNISVELLQKLLREEIGQRKKKNVVQARSFAEMLEQSLRAYQNRAIETAEVIEQLIALAKEMREAAARGEKLGLNEAEAAFYDALETNDSAVAILGDETLKKIARELVEKVRGNVSIDWNLKESARSKLRVMVKGILRKYGYPPDKQERATDTVLEQTEVLCEDWLGTQA